MNSWTWKQKLLLYAAPVLLVVVAANQRYLVSDENLTSWIGGGFGMFATYPTETRRMSITLVTPDKSEFRILPAQLDDRVHLQGRMSRIEREAISHPSPARLRELARELAAADWIAVAEPGGKTSRLIPGLSRDFLGNRADTVPFPVSAVRVEVWKYVPDFQSRRVTHSRVAGVTEEAGSADDARR